MEKFGSLHCEFEDRGHHRFRVRGTLDREFGSPPGQSWGSLPACARGPGRPAATTPSTPTKSTDEVVIKSGKMQDASCKVQIAPLVRVVDRPRPADHGRPSWRRPADHVPGRRAPIAIRPIMARRPFIVWYGRPRSWPRLPALSYGPQKRP